LPSIVKAPTSIRASTRRPRPKYRLKTRVGVGARILIGVSLLTAGCAHPFSRKGVGDISPLQRSKLYEEHYLDERPLGLNLFPRDQGVVVHSVFVEGLGYWAGIRGGDVITEVNNRKIRSAKQFFSAIMQSKGQFTPSAEVIVLRPIYVKDGTRDKFNGYRKIKITFPLPDIRWSPRSYHQAHITELGKE